jgi:hypothetical protein
VREAHGAGGTLNSNETEKSSFLLKVNVFFVPVLLAAGNTTVWIVRGDRALEFVEEEER